MKSFFNYTSLAGTLMVFAVMWGISKIGVQFEFLNVLESTVQNFSLTDLYYKLRDDREVAFDDRIVLVNIGQESRSTVARQILTLNKYQPAVIGIDALFYGENPSSSDSVRQFSGDELLELALANTPNAVIVGEAEGYNEKSNTWDSLRMPHERFAQHARISYANTVTDEDGEGEFATWKRIKPQFNLKGGKKLNSFAAAVLSYYDSTEYKEFLGRNNDIEPIFFKGNIPSADTTRSAKYTVLDVNDVLQENFTPDVLKGRIVLMGYMGTEYTSTSWDADKFYTSLNSNPVGRSWPDMYGVVVHANILSMVLDDNYIDVMPFWGSAATAFAICYANLAFFVWILRRKRIAPWYGAISKLVQLVELVLLGFLTVQLFSAFHFKPQLTLAAIAVLFSADLAEIFMDFVGNILKLHKVEH